MAEVQTTIIWDSPEAEAAYRTLLGLQARAVAKRCENRDRHNMIPPPSLAEEEIGKVLARIVVEHSRPGMIVPSDHSILDQIKEGPSNG